MEKYRCPCCEAHTLQSRDAHEICVLCKWSADNEYALEEGRQNVVRYGVMYRPSDRVFAVVRHPILGPGGEYAIDRVALRARAYVEFHTFGKDKGERTNLTGRLEALLAAIGAADSLYGK